MILTCPSCHTRFQADEAALRRPGGRFVRCANCGHTWRHLIDIPPLRAPPEPVPPPAGPPLAVEARRSVLEPPPAGPPLAAEARRSVLEPPPQTRHSSRAAVAVVLVIAVVAAAVAAAIVERGAIVARYPAAGRLYSRAGLSVEVPTKVLKIGHINPVRSGDGLIIKGEISNSGRLAHALPPLRVTLEDAAEKEVQFKIIPPPKAELQPGEVAHFETPFAHPDEAAKNVVVTFAAR